MTRLLLIGRNGQIGYELQRSLNTLGQVLAPHRHELDLAKAKQVRQYIQDLKPEIIINAAAYTAVDAAESNEDVAMLINGTAPGIIAEEAKKIGAAVIHYSSDYVFDGNKGTPYCETDPTNPLNVYGKSKLTGEEAIQAIDVPHLILRSSWVYGKHGNNFYNTMMRLARERAELGIVDDQTGCPTWSRTIAETTAQLIAQQLITKTSSYFSDCSGIYHLVSSGQTSWYDFAKLFLERDPYKKEQTLVTLKAISTADYPTAAKRPAYSVMSTDKLSAGFKLQMPQWSDCVKMISA